MAVYLPVFTSPEGETETIRAYQAVLDQWPVPHTEIDVSTSFGETHVITSGPETAPTVVLLHALFATATSWCRTVDALSRDNRTYAVDVLGEANRSRPTRPITSLNDLLRWFTELIDALGVPMLYLVGNSFGGFAAAYFAMHLPDRIRKLVLIGPAATFHGILPFYLHMFIPKAMYLFFPWLPGRKSVMRHSVDWLHADLPSDRAWRELFYLTMIHGGMTNQIFPRTYSPAELALIKAPTLLVLGDRERIYPAYDASERARRLMPTIQVQIIPNAHHITALAQPELVNASLVRFLREGESR